MANDLISKKTRSEFCMHFTSWTVREIEREFDSADILAADISPQETSVRRAQVLRHYHNVNFAKWPDVQKLLRVYEAVLLRIDDEIKVQTSWHADQKPVRDRLVRCLERDGFAYANGHITRKSGTVGLAEVGDSAAHLDAPELQRQLDRLRVAVDDDPPLAIGTAKEMVETVCKTILTERGIPFDEQNADVQGLVKAVREALGLLPENIPDSARGVKAMRGLLGNLGTIAQALGELRNLYGTGHGRAGTSRGLTSRHARLAVGAASTLAMFLMETHKERPKK